MTNAGFGKLLKNTRYQTRVLIGRFPVVLPLFRVIPRYRPRVVTKETEICIEGFPRCGNSFFVNVFREWNPGVRMAHHLHIPAQVVRAVQLGIPCIVLIRKPIDALASLLIIDERLSVGIAIRSYLDFYRRILPLRPFLVIADFQEVTTHPEKIIHRVNHKFRCSFASHPFTETLKAQIFEKLKEHHGNAAQPRYQIPVPMLEKQDRKRALVPKIQRSPWIQEAYELYQAFLQGPKDPP